MRGILKVLKFAASGLTSFCLDNAVFTGILYIMTKGAKGLFLSIALASILARIISAHYNYFVNQRFVFKSKGGRSCYFNYFSLVILIGILSWLLTDLSVRLCAATGIKVSVCKMIVDLALFALSYAVQNKIVFKK